MSQRFHLLLLGTVLFLLPATPSAAQEVGSGITEPDFDRVAQSGFQFLHLPTHARQAAIGGVSSVMMSGAAAALNNPAAIALVENADLVVTRMNWIADIGYNAGALVKNLGGWGSLGLSAVYLDYGDMDRTENREILDANNERTGLSEVITGLGTFSAYDLAVGVSYARSMTDRLQLGATVKYVRESIDNTDVSNWSIDVGTLYYTGFRTLRVAMMGSNFGPDVNFAEWEERIQVTPANVKMPMVFKFGAAIDVLEGGPSPHLLTLSSEFIHPNDGPERVHVGTEYAFQDLIFLRGGYRFNYDEQSYTLGGGLNVNLGDIGLKIDYSYWAFGRLGPVHLVSAGFGF